MSNNDDYTGPASEDIAMQLFREGKLKDCIKCTEKILEAYPDDAKSYSILGAAYAQSGNRGMAIAAFEHSVNIEPSARNHYNLGKAYEQSDRIREAISEYRNAADADPSYQPAAEALNRLSDQEAAPITEQPQAYPHHLDNQADTAATTQTTACTPADLSGAAPCSNKTAHTPLDDLQPVGIPSAPIPAAPQLPDLSHLEARGRESDEKARQAQRSMIKAGIIYGIIAGPVGILGAGFMLRFFLISMNLPFLAIEGIILGAIVGFWVGFTCGNDMTGVKTGFLLGLLGHGVPALINGSDISAVLFQGMSGALMLGAAGYFIGMMVEHSIGQ
ncbi:MAG: tetratricopeptide repeat protein [Armatimonadota bacterium]